MEPDAPIDLRDAEGAPDQDADGNVTSAWPEKGKADLDAALAGCKHVAETWSVEVQTHS